MNVVQSALKTLEQAGVTTLLEQVFGSGGVVAYHGVTTDPFLPAMHITAATLGVQLEFLADRYSVLPLHEYVARRRSGRALRGCVAITFDDAYAGLEERALPSLRRFAVPATVFVATAYAETGARYWWDRFGWVMKTAAPDVREEVERAVAGCSCSALHEVLNAVLRRSAGRLPAAAETALRAAEQIVGPAPQRPLTEAELAKLARCDLIDFGCHTVSHPVLPCLSSEEQEQEISASYFWLADRLPRVRPLLAYPFGLYDDSTVRSARAAQMDAAFSLPGRAATSRFGLYTCPRVAVAQVNSLASLRAQLGWFAIPLIAWRHGEWHPRVPRRERDDAVSV